MYNNQKIKPCMYNSINFNSLFKRRNLQQKEAQGGTLSASELGLRRRREEKDKIDGHHNQQYVAMIDKCNSAKNNSYSSVSAVSGTLNVLQVVFI